MRYKIIRFHFQTPLHIGNVRQDYAISEKMLHSDSIYSAIIAAWAMLGIEIPKDLDEKNLGFTISSCFPFYKENNVSNPIYFLPKPFGSITPKNYESHKKIKKVKYLDFESFQSLLKDDFNPNVDNMIGEFYLNSKNSIDKDFIQSEVFARNAVPSQGGNTQIYYTDRIFFKGNSGLFCLAQFDDNTIENKVMAALRYLQDEGIGTDRHVGNGLFNIEKDDIDFQFVESNYMINLSLFCPSDKQSLEKMLNENARYEIIKRGGWISTEPYLTYRKKSIYMFKEGSVFHTSNSTDHSSSLGKIVNLKPNVMKNTANEHNIYRIGKSLFLPIKN